MARPRAKLAAEFPDVYFLQFGGHQTNGKNFASYNARDYEGSYLDGLLAGTMTKSNNLGFIADGPYPRSNASGKCIFNGGAIDK